MALDKSALIEALVAVFGSVKENTSAKDRAKSVAQAIHDYCIGGVPMTQISTDSSSVVGSMTAGPVSGSGTGGIDTQSAGSGLEASKLQKDLEDALAPNPTAKIQATKIGTAIHDYFSKAKVETKDSTDAPLAAPPPVGPVSGSIKGRGGLNGSSEGSGLSGAKPDLEAALTEIWSDLSNQSKKTSAERMGTAIHSFCQKAKISTEGSFMALAVVDPITFSGSYMPGMGNGKGTIQ